MTEIENMSPEELRALSLEELRTIAKNAILSMTKEEFDLFLEMWDGEKAREEARA